MGRKAVIKTKRLTESKIKKLEEKSVSDSKLIMAISKELSETRTILAELNKISARQSMVSTNLNNEHKKYAKHNDFTVKGLLKHSVRHEKRITSLEFQIHFIEIIAALIAVIICISSIRGGF